MKQCIALAGLLCLLASGCAQNELMTRNNGEAAHVVRARNAPRPLITRSGAKPGAKHFGGVQQASYDGCACGDGCASGTCGLGACGNGGCYDGACAGAFGSGCCAGGCAKGLVNGVASGFCGPNGACCMCPVAQQYPEYPRYTPGPPVGQVAYPYYTTRGPRDFLRDNPPTIGPY